MGCPHSGHLRGIPASVRARSAQQKGQTKTSPPSNMEYWIAGGTGVAFRLFMVSEQGQVLPEGDFSVLTGGVAFLSVFRPTVTQDRTVRHFTVLSVAVVAIFRPRPGLRLEVWTGRHFRIDTGLRSCPWAFANRTGGFIESQIRGPILPSICPRDWFPWSDDYLVIVAEELAVAALVHVCRLPSWYF